MSTYAVVIEDAGPNLSAYVPDLPGCVSVGSTVEEVAINMREAIEIYVAALVEFGEDVPAASSQVLLVDVTS